MKVQVLQEDLTKALTICSRFASSRVQLPILANILLDASKNKLKLASTNLEVSVSLTIGAKITEEGSLTIPAKIIQELVNNFKTGQLELTTDKENLELSSNDFNSSILGMNSSEFPKIPVEVGSGSIKLPTNELVGALAKVLFSVSADETRPVLTGVLVVFKEKEVVFVSTDGFRLSQKKVKMNGSTEEKRLIIPKSTLSELVRLPSEKEIEMSMEKSENQVVFGFSGGVLASRVIDGDFPDFEKIIPKESKIKVTVDKEEFLRSVKLASVFARDSSNVIKFNINKDSFEINSESSTHGSQKANVDAKIDGEVDGGLEIAFNYRFLEELIGAINSDDVQMEFSDSNSPVLFLDNKDINYLHIIMPVRLQS